jgi:hypothetical protein
MFKVVFRSETFPRKFSQLSRRSEEKSNDKEASVGEKFTEQVKRILAFEVVVVVTSFGLSFCS